MLTKDILRIAILIILKCLSIIINESEKSQCCKTNKITKVLELIISF
jgi:hypothetical protein